MTDDAPTTVLLSGIHADQATDGFHDLWVRPEAVTAVTDKGAGTSLIHVDGHRYVVLGTAHTVATKLGMAA